MLNSRVSLILVALLAAAAVAGCDTQGGPGAQGDGETSEETLVGQPDPTFVGEEIPAVTVTDPKGAKLKLAEAVGTPVLLNLWATWCGPCIVEMPQLNDLAAELDGQVQVITVSEDLGGAEAVVPFFQQHKLPNLPQWMDTENQLAKAFGGGAVLPLTVMYDAQGRELWRVIGTYDWSSAEAREKVLDGMAAASAE